MSLFDGVPEEVLRQCGIIRCPTCQAPHRTRPTYYDGRVVICTQCATPLTCRGGIAAKLTEEEAMGMPPGNIEAWILSVETTVARAEKN